MISDLIWNKLKPGHKVVCITDIITLNNQRYHANLTIGRTYEILSISTIYREVRIENDFKCERYYHLNFFRIPNEVICNCIGIE